MKILLDTHAILWMAEGSDRLSRKARSTIENFSNEIYVSAVTAWEITTKVRLGKLSQAASIAYDFRNTLKKMSFYELPIQVEHATRAGLLIGDHKDPFDRMLMAQSLAEGIPIVSNETLFDDFHIHRIW